MGLVFRNFAVRRKAACLMAAISCMALILLIRKRQRKRRRFGVHPINKLRNQLGHYNNLYAELRLDEERFFKYTRMNFSQFDLIVKLVRPHMIKRDIKFHKPLPTEMRLVVALRFLATGDNTFSLATAYRIGLSTVRLMVNEICLVIWDVLGPLYVKAPTVQDFETISEGFMNTWNLPHCLGAIDGKLIELRKPKRSGTEFFSYKKSYAINLMAVCDPNYCFTLVEIGNPGSESDSGIFQRCEFGIKILKNTLDVPDEKALPLSDMTCPYFFVGDEAFPLKCNLMIPFGRGLLHNDDQDSLVKKIFNYRLSRARRVIENVFGILASRWRILFATIQSSADTAQNFVKACVVLHNFLMKTKEVGTTPSQKVPGFYGDAYDGETLIAEGTWRAEKKKMRKIKLRSNRNHIAVAKEQRDMLAVYLSNVYTMPNQETYVNRAKTGFAEALKQLQHNI